MLCTPKKLGRHRSASRYPHATFTYQNGLKTSIPFQRCTFLAHRQRRCAGRISHLQARVRENATFSGADSRSLANLRFRCVDLGDGGRRGAGFSVLPLDGQASPKPTHPQHRRHVHQGLPGPRAQEVHPSCHRGDGRRVQRRALRRAPCRASTVRQPRHGTRLLMSEPRAFPPGTRHPHATRRVQVLHLRDKRHTLRPVDEPSPRLGELTTP